MRKMKFYVCPVCGNLIASVSDTSVSCYGKKLKALQAQKAEEQDKLNVEIIENEYCISCAHEMQKSHYILFVAFLTGDTVVLRKQYPEWDLQTRLPMFSHGTLLWYCTRHGLFYQTVWPYKQKTACNANESIAGGIFMFCIAYRSDSYSALISATLVSLGLPGRQASS